MTQRERERRRTLCHALRRSAQGNGGATPRCTSPRPTAPAQGRALCPPLRQSADDSKTKRRRREQGRRSLDGCCVTTRPLSKAETRQGDANPPQRALDDAARVERSRPSDDASADAAEKPHQIRQAPADRASSPRPRQGVISASTRRRAAGQRPAKPFGREQGRDRAPQRPTSSKPKDVARALFLAPEAI